MLQATQETARFNLLLVVSPDCGDSAGDENVDQQPDRPGPLDSRDGFIRDAELDDDQREALADRHGRPAIGHGGVEVWPADENGSDCDYR